MCKVAFTVGPFIFYWYGLFLAFSIITGMGITWWILVRYKQPPEFLLDLVLFGVPIGILFARLFYVFMNWHTYAEEPFETFYLWRGGLDMQGALLGFIIVLFTYTRYRKISFPEWADRIAPGLAAGYIVSRWGDFFTQENFGLPTDAPWGIYIDFGYRPEGYQQYDYFHPIFLYETVTGIFIFFVLLTIMAMRRRLKIKRDGGLFLLLLIMYSLNDIMLSGVQFDMTGEIRYIKIAGSIMNLLLYWIAVKNSYINNNQLDK
jgi:phosphatidylglycerol:prolipoprotein diacylglycerol transferase